MARTSRTLAAAWRHHVLVVDMPRRLQRFYRGMTLRHCVTVLRMNQRWFDVAERLTNVEVVRLPPAPEHTGDAACIEETLRFGLGADAAELKALETVGLVSSLDVERFTTLMRHRRLEPTMSVASQAHRLVPVGDGVAEAWRRFEHTCDIVEVLERTTPPFDWRPSVVLCPNSAPIALVLSERLRAHAHVVCDGLGVADYDYARRAADYGQLDAVPRLLQMYAQHASGGRSSSPPPPPPRYGDADDSAVAVSAAELTRAMLGAMFSWRARGDGNGMIDRYDTTLPRSVNAARAWLFEALNGPLDRQTVVRDELAAAPLWRQRHQGRDFELAVPDLRGHYESARRYADGRVLLAPQSAAWPAPGASTWTTSVVPRNSQGDLRLHALRKAVIDSRLQSLRRRRGLHGGVVLRVSPALMLPAPLYVDFSPGQNAFVVAVPRTAVGSATATALHFVDDMMASRPLLLASIDYVHYYQHFVVRWEPATMSLSSCGRPLRCRLLEAFGVAAATDNSEMQWSPLPRCSVCSRALTDAESIRLGRGPRCRRAAAATAAATASGLKRNRALIT